MNAAGRTSPSRRTFLSLMAATGAASMAPDSLFAADDLDPRVSSILTKYAGVDMHNHAPIAILGTGAADPKNDPIIDITGEQKRSGFAALVYTYPIDNLRDRQPPPGAAEYYNAHIQALNQIDRILERQKIRRVLNLKQLEAAHTQGQPAIIQAAEGAQFIEGRLERVEEAYRRGLRHLQLVHFADNPGFPLGDVQSSPSIGGLTEFGAKVVKECDRLHIVMDLAHGGFLMVKQALAVATQPFVVSHTALDTPAGRAVREKLKLDFRRLVSREHAKIVADAGGIIGLSHTFPTLKDLVIGIKEMVDAIGADHVGIGTDTNIAVPAGTQGDSTNKQFPDQGSAGYMFATANAMLKEGFTPDEVGKIAGGNYCRLFGKVIGDRT